MDHGQHAFAFGTAQWQARGTRPLAAETAFLHHQFDILHELGVHIEVQQRREPAVDRARFLPAAGAHQIPQALVFRRECNPAAGDPAIDAEDAALECEVVHAGENGKAVAGGEMEVGDAAGVPGAFLEGHDVGLLAELHEHLGRYVIGITDRIVINHDRLAGATRHGAEKCQRLIRRSLIHHRRHHHETVHTDGLTIAHVADGLRLRAFRHAREHLHPAGDVRRHFLEHQPLFLRRERLVLTQRAEEDETRDSGFDQDVHVACGRFEVERSVLVHLGGDGGEYSGPMFFHFVLAAVSIISRGPGTGSRLLQGPHHAPPH